MYCDIILCLLERDSYMVSLTISVLKSVFVLRDVCTCMSFVITLSILWHIYVS